MTCVHNDVDDDNDDAMMRYMNVIMMDATRTVGNNNNDSHCYEYLYYDDIVQRIMSA